MDDWEGSESAGQNKSNHYNYKFNLWNRQDEGNRAKQI
jgi:hypothetical protein